MPRPRKAGRKPKRQAKWVWCPLISQSFLEKLAGLLDRVPRPRKAGRKPKRQAKWVWCPLILLILPDFAILISLISKSKEEIIARYGE